MLFAVRYPVASRRGVYRERLEVVRSRDGALSTSSEEGLRRVVVDVATLTADVRRSAYGEVLAARLLTPFEAEGDLRALRSLLNAYVRRSVEDSLVDIQRDYGRAAEELLIDPSHFVLRKVRGLVALYPPLWRVLWWASRSSTNMELLRRVAENFRPVLEELVREGRLIADESTGLYRIARGTGREEVGASRGAGLVRRLESLLIPGRLGVGLPRLVFEEAIEGGWEATLPPDPEEALSIRTETGLQPLAFEGDVAEFVKRLCGGGVDSVRVQRAGWLFNSTYLVEVEQGGDVRRLFVKRYLAWTDVKWVAAKLWSFPLRNFHLSPTVRLSNELFFISYLRERGLRTPHVYGVSWRKRVLLEGAIQGRSLRELWTSDGVEDDSLGEATVNSGEAVARAHSMGVTLGDCKPDNVIVDQRGQVWLVDLEQASLGGDKAWDVAEFVLFTARYLDLRRIREFARLFGEGYLRHGNPRDVERALDPKYVLVMVPVSPVWTQVAALEGLRSALRT
ncbi:MAG: hypothetical protein N3H32_04370 [Nitrososphaeria archaeon]|nr:hypothetical protein [Nitrososphaeria archaeon]MDW8043382.1 lipopolysaccharide kinase InaA family protein [Nitrososphaerota archaeon]